MTATGSKDLRGERRGTRQAPSRGGSSRKVSIARGRGRNRGTSSRIRESPRELFPDRIQHKEERHAPHVHGSRSRCGEDENHQNSVGVARTDRRPLGSDSAFTNPNFIPINCRRQRNFEDAEGTTKPEGNDRNHPLDRRDSLRMAPSPMAVDNDAPQGPHRSFIEVAKPYIFEQKLQECMTSVGKNEQKEDVLRLQGVRWIDDVRRALSLPVRAFNTAVVYYHKFRLLHADHEYNYIDAAAAALFTACKIEDTLKKSREILCAAYNLKLPPADHLSPDDSIFEMHSKNIIGLERLMLEGSSFDFRNRHPQRIVIKIVKACGLPKEPVGRYAYNICADLYRTFAPLKQTTFTMAIACVELAVRLCNEDIETIGEDRGIDYRRWHSSRAEVMETLLDLLELYTHHRSATVVGPRHSIDAFINIRITLNQESATKSLPRFTESFLQSSPSTAPKTITNGAAKQVNGNTAPTSPATPSTVTASPAQAGVPHSTIVRGHSSTVRFMLGAARAREESEQVDRYFKVEEEEYIVEVPITETRVRNNERDRDRDRREERGNERAERDERGDERAPQPRSARR